MTRQVNGFLRAARDSLLEPRSLHRRRSSCAQRCKLGRIPGILIRGGLDLGPPIDLFWRLARDWPESDLVVIDDEGHRGGGATEAAVVRATDKFATSK